MCTYYSAVHSREIVAAIVRIGQRKVIVVNARHLVAVVIDEVGIINEVIQIVCLDNQAVAVESLHVSHLVVIIKGIIIVNPSSIESGRGRPEPSCRIIPEPIFPKVGLIPSFPHTAVTVPVCDFE